MVEEGRNKQPYLVDEADSDVIVHEAIVAILLDDFAGRFALIFYFYGR